MRARSRGHVQHLRGVHVQVVSEELGKLLVRRVRGVLRRSANTGAQPTTATVPTARFITDSGADVLVLTPDSEAVLAAFRG